MKTALVLITLVTTVSAVNIECNFLMKQLLSETELYTCDVSNITITEISSLESVTGTHLSGKSLADVRQFNFGYSGAICNNLGYIPEHIHNFFPDIIGLTFWKCNISTLSGDELKGLPNLEWFYLGVNQVERIPGSLFENNLKMRAVYFFQNKINHVGWDLFSNLQNLTSANFNKNTCIDESFYNSRAGILEMIEILKQKCPDSALPGPTTFLPGPTTNLTEPTTTLPGKLDDSPCSSGDTDDRICQLEEKVRDQQESIDTLKEELKYLKVSHQHLIETLLDALKKVKDQQF